MGAKDAAVTWGRGAGAFSCSEEGMRTSPVGPVQESHPKSTPPFLDDLRQMT